MTDSFPSDLPDSLRPIWPELSGAARIWARQTRSVVSLMIRAGATMPPDGSDPHRHWSLGEGPCLSQVEGALMHRLAQSHPTWRDPMKVDLQHPDADALVQLAGSIGVRVDKLVGLPWYDT
jgi:hypothetical protein